ncbi:hypothetical protein [Streptomyces sp. CRN 30]|uniref:hypothetical protein n=1 Tax=Streptomyces sp. CRN 30 TaxID=3075613 RepID=UPI002A80B057|nr:hypothetical protein [Streptomyces sp. CRN 30]
MGFFSRRSNDEVPADPAMVELGREYGIAKRHGDRKAMRRITRELGATATTDADTAAFQQGQRAYEDIPPVPRPSRGRNRRR